MRGRKSAKINLSTASYCKARMRLPLGLVLRLSRAVAQRLSARQAENWKWRGREIKLVDGTTVSMPDTQDNWKSFPASKAQKGGSAFRGRDWWESCPCRAPP
jgi:hypothetical protein